LLLLIAFQNFRSLSYKLYLLAFLFGLSLTNHLTTVLLAGFSHCSFSCRLANTSTDTTVTARWHQVGVWLVVCVLLSALGLQCLSLSTHPLACRQSWRGLTWDLFKHFLTGQEAQGALRLNAWYSDFSRYQIVFGKMINEFTWAGLLVLRCWGCGHSFRIRPLAAVVTFAAWLANAFFALSFYVPDPDYSSFLLPSHFIQAIWIALGIYALAILLSSYLPRFQPGYHLCLCLLSLFAIPAQLNPAYLPRVDLSDKWAEYRLGQYILSSRLNMARYSADSQLIAPLYYLQVAEGVRPDLDIIVLSSEEEYRAQVDERLNAGQPVYLGRYLPHLSDSYYLHSVGPLTEVKTEPSALPDAFAKVEADFTPANSDPAIILHGFTLEQNNSCH